MWVDKDPSIMENERSKQHNIFKIYFNIIFPSIRRFTEISSRLVFRLQICAHCSCLPSHPTRL